MKKIDLCGQWNVWKENEFSHAGTVPGCIHTDLFTDHDLYYEYNSLNCRFIEEHDWKYARQFTVEELSANPFLVFDGLDTYCDVYLNHKLVGSAANMFIPHKFAVDGILKQGENTLEVCFRSPVKEVEGKPSLSGAFTTERLHSRRMQCTYSWDWVDRFVTCGIFRPAYILFEDQMDLDHVYVYTKDIDSYSAQIKVTENFKNFAEGDMVTTEVFSPSGEILHRAVSYCEEAENVLYFDIADPLLWYPRPYGEQPLYTLKITIGDNEHVQKFGIRTVKLLQLKDTDADFIALSEKLKNTDSGHRYDHNEGISCFIPVINGTRIFCTGANWVPCEPFPSEESDEKITDILEKAALAGINMVRIWGGGIFEKEHFYNECDRLGILVTQDFLMACGEYPEQEADFQKELAKEAEFVVLYLRNHPSLVWWTGDNENAVDGNDQMKSYRGRISARKIIAPILEKYDANRVFLYSSPYGGDLYASKTKGTTHNTQFLSFIFQYLEREDLSDYREYWKEYTARFIAEEPAMGAIGKCSLLEFTAPENVSDYDLWLHHTKPNPGLKTHLLDTFTGFAQKLFGPSNTWEETWFKWRYLQFEWVRYTLGNARCHLWFNSGIIYWMLNDCWPASFGWSLIDYYDRPKGGYYAIKSVANPLAVYIEKEKDGFVISISNQTASAQNCRLNVKLLNLQDQSMISVAEADLNVESGTFCRNLAISLESHEVLIAEITGDDFSHRNWYKDGAPYLKASDALTWTISDHAITVKASEYVHAVEISCDAVSSQNYCKGTILSENYFSLLPGEERVVACDKTIDTETVEITGYTFQ